MNALFISIHLCLCETSSLLYYTHFYEVFAVLVAAVLNFHIIPDISPRYKFFFFLFRLNITNYKYIRDVPISSLVLRYNIRILHFFFFFLTEFSAVLLLYSLFSPWPLCLRTRRSQLPGGLQWRIVLPAKILTDYLFISKMNWFKY